MSSSLGDARIGGTIRASCARRKPLAALTLRSPRDAEIKAAMVRREAEPEHLDFTPNLRRGNADRRGHRGNGQTGRCARPNLYLDLRPFAFFLVTPFFFAGAFFFFAADFLAGAFLVFFAGAFLAGLFFADFFLV